MANSVGVCLRRSPYDTEVEYPAKPGLEARKERILESRRDYRSALKDLNRIFFLAVAMKGLREFEKNYAMYKRAMEFAEETEKITLEMSKSRVINNLGFHEAIRDGYIAVMSTIMVTSIAAQGP